MFILKIELSQFYPCCIENTFLKIMGGSLKILRHWRPGTKLYRKIVTDSESVRIFDSPVQSTSKSVRLRLTLTNVKNVWKDLMHCTCKYEEDMNSAVQCTKNHNNSKDCSLFAQKKTWIILAQRLAFQQSSDRLVGIHKFPRFYFNRTRTFLGSLSQK